MYGNCDEIVCCCMFVSKGSVTGSMASGNLWSLPTPPRRQVWVYTCVTLRDTIAKVNTHLLDTHHSRDVVRLLNIMFHIQRAIIPYWTSQWSYYDSQCNHQTTDNQWHCQWFLNMITHNMRRLHQLIFTALDQPKSCKFHKNSRIVKLVTVGSKATLSLQC